MVTNKNREYLLSGIPWICLFIELYESSNKLIIWPVSIPSTAVPLSNPIEKTSGLLWRNCLQYCLYCLHCFTFVVATWGRGQIQNICTKLRSNGTYSSVRRVPEEVIQKVKPMLYRGVGCHSSDVSTLGTDSCEADEKASELESSDSTGSCRVHVTLDRPLVRRVKVPKNLHHLLPLGVVVLVFPIEFKKMYITQKK